MLKRILMIALLLAAGSAIAAAPVYKWVDSQGNVHYTDVPPPGKGQPVKIHAQPDTSDQTGADQSKPSVPGAGDNGSVVQKECELARAQLASYQKAGYLYTTDSQGKRRVLTEAETRQAIADAQARVTRYCTGKSEDSGS